MGGAGGPLRSEPMRTPVAASLALLVLATAPSCGRGGGSAAHESRPGSGVAFASLDYDEALSRAKGERKLVMLDVYTDWCGWCKKLDRDVFADARVAAALRDVVPIKVNAEKGGEDVARRFSVQGFPTVLFVDATGALVHRIDGYVNADEMLRTIERLPKSRT